MFDPWRIVEETAQVLGPDFAPGLAKSLLQIDGVRLAAVLVRSGSDRLTVVAAAGRESTLATDEELAIEETPLRGLVRGIPTVSTAAPPELGSATLQPSDWLLAASARSRSSDTCAIVCVIGNRERLNRAVNRMLPALAARSAAELDAALAAGDRGGRAALRLRYREALLHLAAAGPRTYSEQLRMILEHAARTLDVARASYWSLVDGGETIACEELFIQATGTFTAGGRVTAAQFPSYFAALRTCQIIDASDASDDARTREFARGYFDLQAIASMLDVPVWGDGRLAGVLCLEQTSSRRHWRGEDTEFARGVAQNIALALEVAARGRAEERYRLVANAVGEVIWEANLLDGTVDWSGSMTDVFRVPLETSATFDWWVSQIHADDRANVQASFEAARQDRETRAWSAEYRFVRGDGTVAFVRDRGFFIRDPEGRAVRALGAMVDVTDQRELQRRIAVTDRMASVGTLAAGVAHEINNPLAYILGNLEHGLATLDERGDDPELLDALREARQGALRVAEIVRGMRLFAKPEPAAAGLSADLDRAVSSALSMARNEIRHRAVLKTHLGAPPRVAASETPLVQVVLNLLVNAAHAIREGSAEDDAIVVTTGVDAGRVFVEVRDTGTGMTPATVSRIFDPFFTTKSVGVGMGLGLSIVHSIVTSFGGDIVVSSTPGQGSTFRVLLEPAANRSVAPTSRRPPASRARVLVVEDELPIANMLRRMLTPDHDVVLASGGKAALEVLLQSPTFDVVLCDVMMPDMTGTDLHRELVVRAPDIASRFVFITGGAFGDRTRDYVGATAQPVVAKPFVRAALLRAIERIRGAT